jgi:hypothetical protein
MITGFNTNVRYSGRVFHVQTEDSGRKNPHVISHVYHGGTILASEKKKYDKLLDAADVDSAVRKLMEEQHKSMLHRLKDGGFDDVSAQRLDGAAAPKPAAPKKKAAPARKKASDSTATAAGPADGAPAAPAPEDDRDFGEGIVSNKPLDEVILEYLVKKSRDRTPAAPPKPARSSRPRE